MITEERVDDNDEGTGANTRRAGTAKGSCAKLGLSIIEGDCASRSSKSAQALRLCRSDVSGEGHFASK